MRIFVNVFPWVTGLFIILAGVIIIALIQFFRIRMFKRLFKELAAVFSKEKNLDYNSLVDRIIQSRELTRAGSSIEVNKMISNTIKRIIDDSRVFIHAAPNETTAERIIKEGFKYSDDFHRTSEEISSDLTDLAFKLQICRPYGKFVMILCIPKKMLHEPDERVLTGDKDLLAEYGISDYDPDKEPSYTLPLRFVYGYADIENKKIVENRLFNIQ